MTLRKVSLLLPRSHRIARYLFPLFSSVGISQLRLTDTVKAVEDVDPVAGLARS